MPDQAAYFLLASHQQSKSTPLDWNPHSLRSDSTLSIKWIGIVSRTSMQSFLDLSERETNLFLVTEKSLIKGLHK